MRRGVREGWRIWALALVPAAMAVTVSLLVAGPVAVAAAVSHHDPAACPDDASARLSSPDAVATNARGSQPGRGPSSWRSPASVRDDAVATEAGTGAESALTGARLNRHLAQLEKYGSAGSKELESGRIRYYGDITPAAKPGEMVGRRLVREWDPATDATRTWHETVDQSGNVRIVRPETGGPKVHYYFDEFGNYGGSW